MNIIINATILNESHLTGLGVYTTNVLMRLIPLLQQDNDISKIIVIGDTKRLTDLLQDVIRNSKTSIVNLSTVNPIKRLILLNLFLARQRNKSNTIFYSPVHHGTIINGFKQIITIHDLFAMIFPQNYKMQHYYFRYYLPSVIKRTDRIITDSKNTATDLARFYNPLPPVEVNYLALDINKTNNIEETRLDLLDKKYFLFIGPSYSYKNADRTITAFVQFISKLTTAKYYLVFIGGSEQYLNYLYDFIEKKHPNWKERIYFTGYVSNQELVWLYKNACATLITTLYEGFGLPALEAMYFGCPVIASKVASLPEICGDAVLYCNPYNTQDIADKLFEIIIDSKLRKQLIERGYQQVKKFSWEKTANSVMGVIKDVSRL